MSDSNIEELSKLKIKVNQLENELKKLNDQIYNLAKTDELTGLPNYRAFESKINEFVYEHSRGKTFSILVVDIDRFKVVNDTHGHLFGNKVIKNVAETLSKSIRQSDFICRYGGEEFVILLSGAGCETGYSVADSLRSKVEKEPTDGVFVTTSIGVVEFSDKYKCGNEAINEADKAMYKAKRLGRNRVVKV